MPSEWPDKRLDDRFHALDEQIRVFAPTAGQVAHNTWQISDLREAQVKLEQTLEGFSERVDKRFGRLTRAAYTLALSITTSAIGVILSHAL